MQAPRLVAKGIRKNAEQIRELARQHGVPIIENKPLARLMFNYGKVGREIPAQLYAAVAEVLAYVYRTNPYRYYAEARQIASEVQPGPNKPAGEVAHQLLPPLWRNRPCRRCIA
jgi:flagellar biosynthesis protein FlhB